MTSAFQEYIDLVVESVLAEKLRGNFDLRQFQQITGRNEDETAEKLMLYARTAGLKLIHCGSSRCTFILSSGKGLKIAWKGEVWQNENEINAFLKFGRDLTPEIFHYSPDKMWLVVELVRPFQSTDIMEKEVGITGAHMYRFIGWYKTTADGQSMSAELLSKFNEAIKANDHWFLKPVVIKRETLELMTKYLFLHKNKVIDIERPDHWGMTADRRIVCIDIGLRNDWE